MPASYSSGLTAEPVRTSWVTIVLWLLALLCFFLVLTCAVWLFSTPVEESTIVTDPTSGQVIQRDTETDLTPMILPAVFFVASLVCLIASVVALLKLRQQAGAPR
jgi:ABC-type Na+ efflux pump permease subunit